MAITHLLYLHGFRSSPQSAKARRMAQVVAQQHPSVQWWCPQLPPSPAEAMRQVMDGVHDWPHDRMAVVGSSLGGFYATWVAHQCRCPSVLLNPAVHPARDLARYIGEQSSWHRPEERFFFRPDYIAELQALELHGHPPAGRELAVVAQGDELLDWREMVARYPTAQTVLIAGSDHALSDFDTHLPTVLRFLGLA